MFLTVVHVALRISEEIVNLGSLVIVIQQSALSIKRAFSVL